MNLFLSLQEIAEEIKKVPQLKRSISAIKGNLYVLDIEYVSLYQIHSMMILSWKSNLYGATIATVGILSFGERLKSKT